MKLKIKVTKDILKRSMMCGTEGFKGPSSKNCAIALACREIFPECSVDHQLFIKGEYALLEIDMPEEAIDFVNDFDYLCDTPRLRLNLPELEFEVTLTDEVLASINIDQLKPMLEKSETLELIEA